MDPADEALGSGHVLAPKSPDHPAPQPRGSVLVRLTSSFHSRLIPFRVLGLSPSGAQGWFSPRGPLRSGDGEARRRAEDRWGGPRAGSEGILAREEVERSRWDVSGRSQSPPARHTVWIEGTAKLAAGEGLLKERRGRDGGPMSEKLERSRSAEMEGSEPQDLLGFVPAELVARLEAHFRSTGAPAYRAEQVRRWVYETGVPSIDGMTNLPASERELLQRSFTLTDPAEVTVSRSVDGTAKHLWRLADGELVESVLIPAGDRLTLCISSQAGCAMGCTFCATGWAGFSRQLSPGEIAAQFRASRRWAEANGYGPISNVVYMGMGEPLANREAVHTSLSVLNRGFGIGARRITVSTVGVVPGILELAARPEQFGLAISLHAPVPELRASLVPLEKRYPLPALMEAVRTFREGQGRRVTFEYTMIRGVNDAEELAPKLAELARSVRAFVNLIPYNPIPYKDWIPSTRERLERFRAVLDAAGVSAAVREPRGRDIDAACGQLRASALVQMEGSRPRRARMSVNAVSDAVPANLPEE
ncbi:MAG: 23S rRNA (adenine(2503)-C(2))-methyltransferase RlmN [Gemmatimonadetes bacterium]|nr:23S rRNA (adenine(2503)-C(2))-methyltransferase RlmN [Gemmatimonadota bacterium]